MSGLSLGLGLSAGGVPPDLPISPSLAFLPLSNATVELLAAPGEITLVISGTAAHDGTYVFDPALLASGPVNLRAPELSGDADPEAGETLHITPGLWVHDSAGGTPGITWSANGTGTIDVTDPAAPLLPTGAADAGATLVVTEQVSCMLGTREARSNGLALPPGPVQSLIDVASAPDQILNGGDGGAVPAGWRIQQLFNGAASARWRTTVALTAGTPYRMTGTVTLNTGAQDSVSRLYVRRGGTMTTIVGAWTSAQGPNAFDVTFTPDTNEAYVLEVSVDQVGAPPGTYDVTDVRLETL